MIIITISVRGPSYKSESDVYIYIEFIYLYGYHYSLKYLKSVLYT